MFTTTAPGLFKTVPCPADDKCKLANCIFSHDASKEESTQRFNRVQHGVSISDKETEDNDVKRRKLEDVSKKSITPYGEQELPVTKAGNAAKSSIGSSPASKKLTSIARTVSPPPARIVKPSLASTGKAIAPNSTQAQKPVEKPTVLTPRAVAKTSAPYNTRLQLLRALHGELSRLNAEIASSKDKQTASLKLTPNEVNKIAVDEEEEVAIKQSAVYSNVMKNKCLRYKKMKLPDWVSLRLENVAKNELDKTRMLGNDMRNERDIPNVEAGLSELEELALLERFVLRPDQLQEAGFITEPPDEKQLIEAQKLVKASGGYETCDRCSSRFQIFSERQENGTFASGGECTYHWARISRPPRDKDTKTRPDPFHPCCLQPPGSTGCTVASSHVYKIHELNAGRLATILQFETTPENHTAKRIAVVFDCEMAYTTCGMEIIRLSALQWPSNGPLIDVLVRPIGQMVDLNTKWSGVTPQQWEEANARDPHVDKRPLTDLPIQDVVVGLPLVNSPAAARKLLTSYISPGTVLIGHALNNDLNVLRLIHPTIVDTSLLYPHHAGLPIRHGLRKLAKDFLNLTIQNHNDAKPVTHASSSGAEQKPEAEGHDSMEDSRATGDLVRLKIAKEWTMLKDRKWLAKDGKFFAEIGGKMREATLPPYTEPQATIKKRKAPDKIQDDVTSGGISNSYKDNASQSAYVSSKLGRELKIEQTQR